MKLTILTASLLALTLGAACYRAGSNRDAAAESQAPAREEPAFSNQRAANNPAALPAAEKAPDKPVSLDAAGKSAAAPMERKVIKNADLTLQTGDPEAALHKISALADAKGGFVVTSEVAQRGDGAKTVRVTARVPAAAFEAFLSEARAHAQRVLSEKQTGQDVTEEFIDLEARIKVQRETEARYLDFLKQAKNVEEALQVQSNLTVVRTEIERLEGRQRFLENQTSLSTINITLQPEATLAVVAPSGFWHEVKDAFRDGLNAAAAIVLFLVRAVITLIPLALLIFLPLGLVLRLVWRRWKCYEATSLQQNKGE
jgi:hypothetical protein